MNTYLKQIDKDVYRQRVAWAMLLLVMAFAVLYARLFFLQIVEGREYRRLSENNCIRLQTLEAPRGLIFDRNGRRLVDNRPAFNLTMVPKDVNPPEETIARLARLSGLSVDKIHRKWEKARRSVPYKPALLKADIGRDLMAVIEVHRHALPGIGISVKPLRHYLRPQHAAHLLGYMGEIRLEELKTADPEAYRSGDYVGRAGIEKTAEKLLHGQRGGRQVEVNARGQVIRVLETVAPTPGCNLFLTIDASLQEKAEALLTGLVGAVVAIEPASGKVLALASSPGFDQNAFIGGISSKDWRTLRDDPGKPMSNKAIQGAYPPGSTYKIITALAGLEEGVIGTGTAFHCPGHYRFGDRTFRCWKRWGHGRVTVVRALAESCDVYFYQIGQRLGVDRLAWYAAAAGLGASTGINLPHEAGGLVPTAAWKKKRTGRSWQRGETLSVSIGQGYNLATPLQLAVMTAAVAQGGVRYRPILIDRVEKAGGEVVRQSRPEVLGRLPVSPASLDIVRRGLWEVVNGEQGTARMARLENVEIAGKTGTAQVFTRKTKQHLKEEDMAAHLRSHAWFVAYAPFRSPQIAVAVLVEHGAHGSSTASPIARDLIDTYLNGSPVKHPPPSSEEPDHA